jgi:RNA polymerase sigma-70 factor (ECF subfamily)
MQLADCRSEPGRQRDREHDRSVLARLMDLIAPLFEPSALAAFRRVAIEEVAPDQVTKEMGVSLNAVLAAKSRVLSRLRQEAGGLID